jgi:hypothetical protein
MGCDEARKGGAEMRRVGMDLMLAMRSRPLLPTFALPESRHAMHHMSIPFRYAPPEGAIGSSLVISNHSLAQQRSKL